MSRASSGFTLIEVLLYVALLGLIMGGAVTVAYQIMEATGRNQASEVLYEEANYLLAKMGRMIAGATVQEPAVHNSGARLVVSKRSEGDESVLVSLEMIHENQTLFLKERESAALPLNDSFIQVDDIEFRYESAIFEAPELLEVRMTLSTSVITGGRISRVFAERYPILP